jgi:GTP-binding protein HflX
MVDLKRTELSVRAERAVLMQVYDRREEELSNASLAELRNLAATALANVVGEIRQPRNKPDPSTYLGKGKVEELADMCRELDADIVICDDDLKPSQVKNLETILDRKVVDRSELILDIFAQHARTKQAMLQVELAQLEYAFPRLKKMWTHLDRLAGGTVGAAGGIGVRGPGEKQLESDRRMVEKRIFDLKRELAGIEERHRIEAAKRNEKFKTAALVGYTNAGKSTLMNALTGAGVSVRDRLFETLDTRTRQWLMPDGRSVMLSDTVGFIRKLPHHLVASFHATLEEARTADVLLHVADASNPTAEAQIDAVEDVLKQLRCRATKRILVLNKVDAVTDPARLHLLQHRSDCPVCVSALTGEGLEALSRIVQGCLDEMDVELTVETAPGNGKLVALLHDRGAVLERSYTEGVARFRVKVPPDVAGSIEALGGRVVRD